jgi:SAM-dependent methyltransferase
VGGIPLQWSQPNRRGEKRTADAEDPRTRQRRERASHHFDPEHLLEHEERLRALGDPVELLRSLLAGDERLLVDVGAGVGRMSLAAAALLPAAQVLAIDHQADMVAQLEKRFRAAGLDSARAVRADAAHLPLGDGEADAVLLSVVLHDVADPAAVLREARRVLKAAGRLVLFEVRPGALDDGPPQELLFDPVELAQVVAAAGFAPGPVLDGPGPLYRVVARPLS